ncbi:MAG: cellulase family glycosylhydrolase [Anaerolineales bacterium]|nr:cellulase family glycosylhydrolase [Anaerolineales bacterium]
MTPNPLRSRTNLSILIGVWLGLTAVVGLCAFGTLYWLLTRNGGSQTPAATNTPPIAATLAPPATATQAAQPAATEQPKPTQAGLDGGGPACNFRPEPASGFGYGIQSHVFVGDNAYWLGVISDKLGFNWVKMQVRWYDLQRDNVEPFWDVLDAAMNEACNKGLRVMLSVVAAPDWTRANPMPAPEGQEAPPDNPLDYAEFVQRLLDRYPGRIGAIEVWNEMNLEREWNTAEGVSPTAYIALLQAAYTTIKAADPNIVVISGALSPTGINCNVSFPDCQPSGRPIVMDDVTYLRGFVDNGGLNYVDCVGTHSNGTNLPPDVDGANPPPREGQTFGGPWDNPHYSWALKSQVETYAAIIGNVQQCVTEFGYASPVDGVYPANFGFAADVTAEQQADYLVRAFNWMRDSHLVKMASLFNLDYGPKGGDPATDDNVIFSILDRSGIPRPAFDALSVMPKP